MKLLISIDDTDTINSKGTGAILSEIAKQIEDKKLGKCGRITRHQLLLHEEIPYTSHNSSMCLDVWMSCTDYEKVKKMVTENIRTESADGSDPGLCIAQVDEVMDINALIAFGLRTKREIIQKNEAYALASNQQIYLTEQGGTGQGVIGAIAGVGLRLSGNDGELKGGVSNYTVGNHYRASELLCHHNIDRICDTHGNSIQRDSVIKVQWKVKPILLNDLFTVVVKKVEFQNCWITFNKKELRRFEDERMYDIACKDYEPDVEEEMISPKKITCLNCRYRKWTQHSILCIKERVKN